MLRSEFEQRVNYKVTEEEFKSINEMYMDTDLDKDDFCLLYNASQFITQKVARLFASLGFPVFSEISLNTDVSVEEVNQAIIDEKISVSLVEKALASFLEKGAGRKSPCDNCRDFYDNEYGSCAFGCSKLREFEGREPDYDLLG